MTRLDGMIHNRQYEIEQISIIQAVLEGMFNTDHNRESWLNSPHPDLDYYRPIELLEKGKIGIVYNYLRSVPGI